MRKKWKIVLIGMGSLSVIGGISIFGFDLDKLFTVSTGNNYTAVSHNQKGGITAAIVNLGDIPLPDRALSREERVKLISDLPSSNNICIFLENRFDNESIRFANRIRDFLLEYNMNASVQLNTEYRFVPDSSYRPTENGIYFPSPDEYCSKLFIMFRR